MNTFFKKLLRGDTTIWLVFFALCIGSVLIMYSASSVKAYEGATYSRFMLRHAFFILAGIGVAYGIHFIPYKYIRILSYVGIIAAIVLLVLLPFIGTTKNNATRWIELFGFEFQPSEFAKLSLILIVADFISRIKENDPESERIWFRRIMILTATVCLLNLRASNSAAILLFGIVFIMMFIGRFSYKRLLPIALAALVLMGCIYYVGKNFPDSKVAKMSSARTFTNRIDRFFVDEPDNVKYSFNTDFQAKQAKVAIANGGFFGVGIGNSIQRDYLPYAYSDFIYAIILEEGGLIMGVILILLYLALLFRAGQITVKCTTVYPAMVVIGLALIIVIQALLNISVAIGLLPVTGQTLPLISHGGTSIIITSVYFGIILGVTRQIKESQQKEAETKVAEIPVVELEDL